MLAEQNESNLPHFAIRALEMGFYFTDGDRRGLLQRISVDSGANSRKGDESGAVLFGQREATAVAGRQHFSLAVAAIAVDRADGVKDVFRGKASRARHHRLAGGAGADRSPDGVQLSHDLRAAGAMDSAIHAASAGQRRIGGINDGVRRHPCDVALLENDLPSASAHPFHTFHYNRFVTRRELLIGGMACGAALWGRTHWDRSRISAITDEIGKTADDAADLAHQNGLLFVEVRNQPGSDREYATGREVDMKADATELANRGMKVSLVESSLLKFAWPGMQPAKDAPDQARWDRRMEDLHLALRCAHVMGADKVSLFAGTRSTDPAGAMQQIADTIGGMSLEAEKQKVALLVRNDASTNVADTAELAALMKLVASKWVGIDWRPAGGDYAALPKEAHPERACTGCHADTGKAGIAQLATHPGGAR